MKQTCENCKLYQAFYTKSKEGAYQNGKKGNCWICLKTRKRNLVVRDAATPACDYFEEREPETRKTITCTLSSPGDEIIGNCVLLVDKLS